jgi:hypothetical protein
VIISWLVGMFAAPIMGLLSLLPDVNFDVVSAFDNKFTSMVSYIKALDTHWPAHELMTCIGVLIGFELARFVYRGVNWAYHQIPLNH